MRTSWSVIRIDGPCSFFFSGLSSRTTSAVITLATLAAGMAVSFPEVASMPSPETATAAEPPLGHGSVGTVPAVVDWPGTAAVTATAGIGRKKLKVRKAAIRSSSTPAIRSSIPDKIAGSLGPVSLQNWTQFLRFGHLPRGRWDRWSDYEQSATELPGSPPPCWLRFPAP